MTLKDKKIFSNFYDNLENQRDIFYIYFSKGLLYFALESISRVPENVNLLVIVSAAEQSEKESIAKYINRPVVYLEGHYPDMVIWEMLFEYNKYNFGWMDVDCFVFDSSIFTDLTILDDTIGINTVWAGQYTRYQIDCWLGNTFFTFYNKKVMNEIFDKYGYISPRIARFPNKNLSYLEKDCYIDLSEEYIKFLKEKFPSFIENERGYFDTTHLYQIFVLLNGKKIGRVRNVDSLHEYYFKGALHLGGCNRIHEYRLDNPRTNNVFKFNMRFSFLLLKKYLPILPDSYKEICNIFVKTMEDNDINTDIDNLKSSVYRYMKRNNMDFKIMNFSD